MILKYLDYVDIKDNWLHGRLYNIKDSPNISKLFNILTDKLNIIIDYANRIYPSIYPCLGVELLQEHAVELGLPDSIFRNDVSFYQFPYTFPLPFKDGVTSRVFTDLSILRKDIICKKYYMADNSTLGFKRIGALYNVCIDIEEFQTEIKMGTVLGVASNGANLTYFQFPYQFPLYFGKGVASEWSNRWTQKNPTGKTVTSKVKITIYQTDDLTYLKLKEIFRWMSPLSYELVFDRKTVAGTCDLSSLQLCEYLK